MFKFKTVSIFVFVLISLMIANCEGEENMIDISRSSTVEIVSKFVNSESRGTGFFISDQYVVTCFHVIALVGKNINISQNIQIRTNSGEIIGANVVSLPTQIDASPFNYDFAILKLTSRPNQSIGILKLAQDGYVLKIGSDVIFSGYPLGAPMMLTHKGMISGVDDKNSIIGIQASINKGNSGGALLDFNGDVLGIIDAREGGISNSLQDLNEFINTPGRGRMVVGGVDPVQAIQALIGTLDTYISTGIGYAINIKFLREYLEKYPNLLS